MNVFVCVYVCVFETLNPSQHQSDTAESPVQPLTKSTNALHQTLSALNTSGVGPCIEFPKQIAQNYGKTP